MTSDSLVVFDSPITSKGKPRQRVSVRGSLAARFAAKVNKTDGCWLWTGGVNRKGYGTIGSGGKDGVTRLAPRVSWELHVGPIPEGMDVLHRCDNPPCVRPDHLFLGTDRENCADMRAKGRAVYHNTLKTHCKSGHPFDRTCDTVDGRRRHCSICQREARRAHYRTHLKRGIPCAQRTACPSGHPYDAENTYHYRGQRQCLTCRRAHTKAKNERRARKSA